MFIKEHSVSEATKNALHCKISDNEKEQARPFYITKAWATKNLIKNYSKNEEKNKLGLSCAKLSTAWVGVGWVAGWIR